MSLGQENLISKALRLCGRRAGVQMNKVIPLGGGLGGGSADAAAILRWAAYDKLAGAASLGSDVPFCVVGGRARVTGVGDIVEPLAFEPRTLVLCIPPIHCDTGAVYRALDQLRSEGKRHAERNDLLEGAVLAEPMLAGWLDELKALTGVEPHLAGSGSTLFVEGSKEDLGFSGVDRVEHRGQWAELIEARSVPSSYGAPQAL
jgi:4-diphosphocytidyl-2-C-methyl-D-erythritol kinase